MARYKAAHCFDPPAGLALRLDVLNKRRPWTLLEPLRYTHGAINLTVPAGFQCDLTSIPHWLWSVPGYSIVGRHVRAGLVHDWMYREQTEDRDVADTMFKAIMRNDGVPFFRCWVMYLAVRFCGQRAWDANAAETEQRSNDKA